MTNKIMIWIMSMIMLIPVVSAQTGIFDAGTAGTFATTGIVIVVIIFVIRDLFKRFFKRK